MENASAAAFPSSRREALAISIPDAKLFSVKSTRKKFSYSDTI
jgi:hypothetical protein